ncbi:hypothetical protein [uncultured Friedmanniella sp.]|uniref:hypothetical protein n=1 Tax=uncultured Friedmanniella sp. TaxID=335381 RepID=UPI0035CC6AA8
MAARGRWGKVGRVLGGIALMLAFVAVVGGVLVSRAGRWGVPYFSFTSAHGSHCTNNLTGYTCSPLTLADVEFFGDVRLPEDTTVGASTYRATHDFALDARLEVPRASAAAASKQLRSAYGRCQKDAASPLVTAGLRDVCAMVNPDGAEADGQLSSRVYAVGTGLRRDGTLVVAMSVRSR